MKFAKSMVAVPQGLKTTTNASAFSLQGWERCGTQIQGPRQPPKVRLLGGLVVMLLLSFAPGSLWGQDQSPASPSQQQAQPPAKQPEGFGRQLARETREAAGEEKDETGEFKKSASVEMVARLTGMSIEHTYLFSVVLNFVVIAAVIGWAGRKYLPGLFRDRTTAIQRAMQEAQKASEGARRKLAEIEARLMKLDVEIGMMRDAAEKEAMDEEARIHAAAQEDARKVVASAEQEIAAAAKAARRELTAYAADLAVGLAQKQIHVDAATDQALVRNFSGQLNAAVGGSGKDRN